MHFYINKDYWRQYYYKFLGHIILTTTGQIKSCLVVHFWTRNSLTNVKCMLKKVWTKHSLRHPVHKTDGKIGEILETPFQGLLASTSVSVSDICVVCVVCAFVHACIQAFEGTCTHSDNICSTSGNLGKCFFCCCALILDLLWD